ncbi:major facilitator superfamily domain-containing protein [Boletus edulis BED1]|uniref:Major facilitator superfamily domain-containing protein n=1 Tax=Boletus edulis BED1 TaxID=1328754 RepID=A0AAD4BDL1_BOLED|nr:major facilitator superfamily domain-containing protein [Boletus edulis BED1]
MSSEEGKNNNHEKDCTRHIFEAETQDVYNEPSLDPVYQAKAQILNDALQEIGMGKYQWFLFVVAGLVGYRNDNLWPIVTGLILSPVVYEFNVEGPYLKLAQNIGLLVGAAFWGVTSNIWGRRWAFNLTLLITAVFAIAAGASPNYTALCSLTAVWSIGVGGNLPVDSAVFLEFVPASHQYLLTVLSIWWAFGQLLGGLVRRLATPLLSNFSCLGPLAPCPRSSNEGWRYFLYTMGGLMMILWILRFFVFSLYESPKDEVVVEMIHKVAAYNGKASSLTVEYLKSAEKTGSSSEKEVKMDVSAAAAAAAIRRKLVKFDLSHVKPLFATRKLAYSTGLLITLWALIGLAFPLLQTRGADFGDSSVYITYRNQIILSVIGVPGALLAGYLVELPLLGCRGTLSIFTILTGAFILASTMACTSNALLGWNCGCSFTKCHRCECESYIRYHAGAIFLAAGFIALLLPFEPRGKVAL